jgi:hypothetical protein
VNGQVKEQDKSIVFTSDEISNSPVYRLSYSFMEGNIVNTKLEISQTGEKFVT